MAAIILVFPRLIGTDGDIVARSRRRSLRPGGVLVLTVRPTTARGVRGETVERVPRIGQLVISCAGRDAGRAMVVVSLCDRRHVLVSDGRLRPGARPKRKNIRHLSLGVALHAGIAAGKPADDAEIRGWLAQVATDGWKAGCEEGREEARI